MKTVLHVVSAYPSASNRLALQLGYATGRWNLQLVNLQAKNADEGRGPEGCRDCKVLPHWPPGKEGDPYPLRKAKSALRRLTNTIALARILAASRADLLHAHENAGLWAAAFWAVVLRRPVVWDPHDFFHENLRRRSRLPRGFNVLELLERMVVRSGAPIFVVSEGLRRKFIELYPRADVHVLFNYSCRRTRRASGQRELEDSAAEIATRRDAAGGGTTRIVYPGLIRPDRLELEFILKVGSLEGVTLDLYGEDRGGSYHERLARVLSETGIENVHLRGRYASDTIIEVLEQYHYAVFPFPVRLANIDFCLPNKFFQCMEAGLPVIMTDMSEMGGIVRSFGLGHVFPSGNYEDYARIQTNVSTSDGYVDLVSNVLRYTHDEVRYAEQQALMTRVYSACLETIRRRDWVDGRA